MIQTTAVGRIGRPPELKTAGQSQVLEFPLAVDKAKKNGQEQKPDWYEVQIWGTRAAALAPHLPKGQQVIVTGRQEIQTWSKQDGSTGTKVVINANDIAFGAAPKGGGQQANSPAPAQAPKPVAPPAVNPGSSDLDAIFASEDEIPF